MKQSDERLQPLHYLFYDGLPLIFQFFSATPDECILKYTYYDFREQHYSPYCSGQSVIWPNMRYRFMK